MSGIKLAVVFFDGLDHDFVRRNYRHSSCLARQVDQASIHRVNGVPHSLSCLAQVFAGARLDLFAFKGHAPLPESERILNWDMLLSHFREEDLLWNRLNRLGYRVGMFEMLGICLSPTLEGFSVTKNVGRVGLGSLFDRQLSHCPSGIGERVEALKRKHGYPVDLVASVDDVAGLLTGPLEQLSDSEAVALMHRCRYGELIDRADACQQRLFRVLRDLLAEHPVEVLLLHTGLLDLLLHLFFEREEEPRVMAVLDHIYDNLTDLLGAEEILAFSDHGMVASAPHLADRFLHRTYHWPRSAVVMASGRRLCTYLATHPPADLTAVYLAASRAMEEDVDRGIGRPAARASAEERATQLERILAGRDRLVRAMDRELEGDRQRIDLLEGALARSDAQLAHLEQEVARLEDRLRELADGRRRPGLLGQLWRRVGRGTRP